METEKLAVNKTIFLIIAVSLLVLFSIRILFPPKTYKKSQVLMGTVVNITIIDRNLDRAEKACELAFQEMQRIEKLFSTQDKSSEISKLNQGGDSEFLKTEPEIIFLLKESLRISSLTQGAFDISIKPLVDLWKEKLEKDEAPTQEEIFRILPLVDYRNIEVDSQKNLVRFKRKGVKLDLGAIAKGYAVDQAIKILKKNGIKNCLVVAGGDLFALGKGKNRLDWLIGLKHPRKSGLILEFRCANKGVATSGDYERFKILNKKRYHHLLDPQTGLPGNKAISATIIAPNAMLADALATAVFILGEKDGLSLIKKMKDVEGIVIVEKEKGLEIFMSQEPEKLNAVKILQGFLKNDLNFPVEKI